MCPMTRVIITHGQPAIKNDKYHHNHKGWDNFFHFFLQFCNPPAMQQHNVLDGCPLKCSESLTINNMADIKSLSTEVA